MRPTMRRGNGLFLSTLSLRRATPASIARAALYTNFYPRSPCGERRYPSAVSRPHAAISIHALLAESDLHISDYVRNADISIHALLAESDAHVVPVQHGCQDFYPRSPCGERLSIHFVHLQINVFLSTLSLRRATSSFCPADSQRRHFYPRSPCGERPYIMIITICTALFLSTLSLRRATKPRRLKSRRCVISIHALLAESDLLATRVPHPPRQFLSTLSLRRATKRWYAKQRLRKNFYPRSPCGERPAKCRCRASRPCISIHALLAESDLAAVCYDYYSIGFLSTLSLRRATWPMKRRMYRNDDFYPRSPCGERQVEDKTAKSRKKFLSTLSLRRATMTRWWCARQSAEFLSTLSLRRATTSFGALKMAAFISIHALLAESDLGGTAAGNLTLCISIHALLAESDASNNPQHLPLAISIHALLAESDEVLLCMR